MEVKAGDVLLFKQQTPHYGSRNPSTEVSRIVLFDILSAGDVVDALDAYQVFAWMVIDEATGFSCSPEFRAALERAHVVMPYPLHRLAADIRQEHVDQIALKTANFARMVKKRPSAADEAVSKSH
jgi:hypothetical protein